MPFVPIFSAFFDFSAFFASFTFSKHIFAHFVQVHFQNAFVHIFHIFLKYVKKNATKCDEHIWKSSWEGATLISFSSGLIFFGSSFAAVTLLPAQLLQVENRRGAVQIDRKWTVQIADLRNLAIAKQ